MELEIEDKLQEIYKNIVIEVNFVDFRKYEINIIIENKLYPSENKFIYFYNTKQTLESNINIISHIIDKYIIEYYKKGE